MFVVFIPFYNFVLAAEIKNNNLSAHLPFAWFPPWLTFGSADSLIEEKIVAES